MFDIVKTKIVKAIENYKYGQPYNKIADVINEHCIKDFIHPTESIKVLDQISLINLSQTIKNILNKINIVTYIEGNYDSEFFKNTRDILVKYFDNFENYSINLEDSKLLREDILHQDDKNKTCVIKNDNKHETDYQYMTEFTKK